MSGPGSRPASQAQSVISSQPASGSGIDLDVSRLSRLSQYSTGSTSTLVLGGSQYPVGTVIGSSGKFVIGDPAAYSKKSQSTPSINTTTSIRNLIISQGYDFEDWNWPVIRFSCFLLLVAVMIGLLAAVIGLSVQSKLACNIQWEWWQGSVMYRIDATEFHDALLRDDIGDIVGIKNQLKYLTGYLGVGIIMIKNLLPAVSPGSDFTMTRSFYGIDERMGTMETFTEMTEELHRKDVQVMLELDPYSTSDQHDWFLESRVQSQAVGNIYKNFYVWRDRPEGNAQEWTFDRVRNQYYFTGNRGNQPILDWGNRRVQEEFGKVIDYWFERGVDGIYLNNVENLYGLTDEGMVTVLDTWKPVFDKYSSINKKRAMMVPYSYVELLRKRSPQSMKYVLKHIHLVDAPLIVRKENGTADFRQELEDKQWLQQQEEGPWICWHWLNMTNLGVEYWPAMEMFLLSIPGTPSIINGQEVGRDPQSVPRSDGRPRLMTWQLASDPPLPYQMRSPLGVTTLKPFSEAIKLKQEKLSLRSAGEEMDQSGNLHQVEGYKFHRLDSQQVLMERFFRMQDRIYFMAYFGPYSEQDYDWSFITTSVHVLVDSRQQLGANIKLNHVTLAKGQALLTSLHK